MPPPTPTSPETNRTSSTPAAAPRRCSARTPASASLPTTMGASTPRRAIEAGAQRDVDPAEVGGHRDEAVAPADDARDGDPDPDERHVGAPAEVGRQRREVRDDVVDGQLHARAIQPDLLEPQAAEPDDRRRDRVDEDLEGEDRGARRVEPDERGGATRGAEPDRAVLGDEASRRELAHQGADRAAGEAGRRDEIGAGQRAALVQPSNDCGKVRAADRLAALPDVRAVDQQGL